MEAGSYPGAGITHDGNQAVQEDHRHGEDKEEQQDYADDGIVAVVKKVQVCAAQHDGEQGHKGVKDIVELLHRQSTAFVCPQILPLCIESANVRSHQACQWAICRNMQAHTHASMHARTRTHTHSDALTHGHTHTQAWTGTDCSRLQVHMWYTSKQTRPSRGNKQAMADPCMKQQL